MTPLERLKLKGTKYGSVTQIVAKFNKKIGSLIQILGFLIADDGVHNRSNRESLLSSKYE